MSVRDWLAADPGMIAEHELVVTPPDGEAYEPLEPGIFIALWDRRYLVATAEPGLFDGRWKYRLEPVGEEVCDPCWRGDHTACGGGDGLTGAGCECYVRRLNEAHDWTAEFSGDEA